jgi:DNA topoisomerase-1
VKSSGFASKRPSELINGADISEATLQEIKGRAHKRHKVSEEGTPTKKGKKGAAAKKTAAKKTTAKKTAKKASA